MTLTKQPPENPGRFTSCLRLVSAVVMEIAEDWQTADKRYLTFSD